MHSLGKHQSHTTQPETVWSSSRLNIHASQSPQPLPIWPALFTPTISRSTSHSMQAPARQIWHAWAGNKGCRLMIIIIHSLPGLRPPLPWSSHFACTTVSSLPIPHQVRAPEWQRPFSTNRHWNATNQECSWKRERESLVFCTRSNFKDGTSLTFLVQVRLLLRVFLLPFFEQTSVALGSGLLRVSRQLGPWISRNLTITQDLHLWGRTLDPPRQRSSQGTSPWLWT